MTAQVAFVAGATGYVGREVVRLLCQGGLKAIAHVRPGSSSRDEWTERFAAMGAVVDATAWEDEAMSVTLTEAAPNLVFALLGTTRRRAKAESIVGDPYERIDYGLTAMLYRAAASIEPAPKFIYLSAAGVSDSARGAYMRARVRAEALIRGGSLPYVIARPAIITGPDRDESRTGERVMGKVLDGGLSVLGALGAKKLKARYRSTTNTTLAGALVRLALGDGDEVVAEGDALR